MKYWVIAYLIKSLNSYQCMW